MDATTYWTSLTTGRLFSYTKEEEFLELYRNFVAHKTGDEGVKRELQYTVIEKTSDHVVIEVTHQTHIGTDFAKGGRRFRNLFSLCLPDYIRGMVFVWGSALDMQNEKVQIPIEGYYTFAFDVYMYNKTEGGYKEIG